MKHDGSISSTATSVLRRDRPAATGRTLQNFLELIILGHGPTFWAEIGPLALALEPNTVFRPHAGQVARTPQRPDPHRGVMPKPMPPPEPVGRPVGYEPLNALARDPNTARSS